MFLLNRVPGLGGPRVHIAARGQGHEVSRSGADRRDVLAVQRGDSGGVLHGDAAATAREIELG